MIKYYKKKGTEIRKVAEVDENDNKKVIAIIGQVAEMLKHEIIFPDNTAGNLEKWLLIRVENPEMPEEYETLEDAKAAIK